MNNFNKANDKNLLKVAALDIPEIDHREYKVILKIINEFENEEEQ